MSWLLNLVANFFVNLLKEFWRDQELKEEGRLQQREADAKKAQELTSESKKIDEEVEASGAQIGDDL